MKLTELIYLRRYAVGLHEPADYVGLMQRFEQVALQPASELASHSKLRSGAPLLAAALLCAGVSVVENASFWLFVPVLLVVAWLSFSRDSIRTECAFYEKHLAEFHAGEISVWLTSKGIHHTVPCAAGRSG